MTWCFRQSIWMALLFSKFREMSSTMVEKVGTACEGQGLFRVLCSTPKGLLQAENEWK